MCVCGWLAGDTFTSVITVNAAGKLKKEVLSYFGVNASWSDLNDVSSLLLKSLQLLGYIWTFVHLPVERSTGI